MKALIVSGYGINCEREMALACEVAGFNPILIHTQTLLTEQVPLSDFALINFPGGFAFGDELGAGKVFANRIAYAQGVGLKDRLLEFVEKGGCILGVCNGFQLLVKLGLLPGALAPNASGQFVDKWVYQRVTEKKCIFTDELTQLYLPIRHGEGRYLGSGEGVLEYVDNPNGSERGVAGVTDRTGRILGMMAHPEAALFFAHDPRAPLEREKRKRRGEPMPTFGDGYALFHNVRKLL